MIKNSSKWLSLLGGLAIGAASWAYASQDSAIIDTLVKKGIINDEEAKQLQADMVKQAQSESSTTISAKIFADFTSITAKDSTGKKLVTSGVGTDVKRFYLGVDHKFNDIWSMNIKYDAGYSASPSTGTVTPFIKTAYIQAKFADEAIVQIGSADEPWIPFVEDQYGMRYVENTLIDRLKFGNSPDWGVHFKGSHDIISYNFAAVNGGGYKNPTRTKGVDFEGRISVEPTKGLVLAVGGYSGDLGKNTQTVPSTHTADRVDALVSYKFSKFKVGAEYYTENNWGQTAAVLSDKSDGYGVFGQVYLDKQWSVFGRYDYAKVSKDIAPGRDDNYFNVGVQYAVMKGLDISLVYKHEKIDNAATGALAKYDEIGIFTQASF